MTATRLIDADALLDCIDNEPPINWTDSEAEIQQQSDWEQFKHMVDNAPTIELDAIVDDFSRVCQAKGHHDWRMVAIEHDEAGDRINTYRCLKCGEEFNVKFVT